MATREILKDGERALTKKSRPVTDFNNRLHILLDDMRETLIDANGLGLAAPQVGILRRAVLIVKTDDKPDINDEENEDNEDDENNEGDDEYDDEKHRQWYNEHIVELINPEIINYDGEQTGSEGCLSVPGVYGLVTRPQTVVVRAQNRHGDSFVLEVGDLTARAVCHEVDHLDGVIFTSLVEKFLTEEELAELRAQHEQEGKKDQ